MNVAINSQIQSPLVRVLQTVPAQAESFTHHIPDNIPPVSKEKLVLAPYNSPGNQYGSEFKFKIPEYGYLRRIYLRVKSQHTGGTTAISNEFFVHSQVKLAKLQTHNKDIQTLYGDEIAARSIRTPSEYRTASAQTNQGVNTSDYKTLIVSGNNAEGVRWVELPFAACESPHVNFSTRFVEDLELHVETNSVASLFSVAPTAHTLEIEAVCLFHNFHDTTEQAIRNENYQEGEPASVLLYDTYEEASVVIPNGTLTQTIDLKSNNLAYGITIVSYIDTAGSQWLQGNSSFSNIELWTTSQKYVFGSQREQVSMDYSDYKLSTRSENELGLPDSQTDLQRANYIQFGLQHNELVNTGCVGLQTINNPQLRLTLPVSYGFDMRVKVYVHYHALVRIDSGSGVVTRTIDQ